MFDAVLDEPPFENGIMWLKCRFSTEPHCIHLPIVDNVLKVFSAHPKIIDWFEQEFKNVPSTIMSLVPVDQIIKPHIDPYTWFYFAINLSFCRISTEFFVIIDCF